MAIVLAGNSDGSADTRAPNEYRQQKGEILVTKTEILTFHGVNENNFLSFSYLTRSGCSDFGAAPFIRKGRQQPLMITEPMTTRAATCKYFLKGANSHVQLVPKYRPRFWLGRISLLAGEFPLPLPSVTSALKFPETGKLLHHREIAK